MYVYACSIVSGVAQPCHTAYATAERRHKDLLYACKLHRTHPLPSEPFLVCYVQITCSVACNFWWSNVNTHV